MSLLIMVSSIQWFFFVVAQGNDSQPYVPTLRDHKLLDQSEVFLMRIAKQWNKELLVSIIWRCQTALDELENPQSQYVLYQISKTAEKAFAYAVTQESRPVPPEVSEENIPTSRKTLYVQYHDLLNNPDPIPQQCITYYDQIDQLAKKMDFPTPLIIATRFKEHSCYLSNPKNGRGNFQITSKYYEPGEITIDEFLYQAEEFITFSRNKWDRYDKLQMFDEIPVSLSYNTIDLLSIQKHAVLYNGLYAGTTPQNSSYANAYFGTWWTGRDGIVATVLKAIEEQMK